MSRQTLSGVVVLRAPRRRMLAAVLAGLALTATAVFAGTLLSTTKRAPLLTVVGDYEPVTAQRSLANSFVPENNPDPNGLVHSLADDEGDDTGDAVNEDHLPESQKIDTTEIRWFNNRPIRPVRTMSMIVTAYSPDERSCGKWADGITASGYSVWTNGMKLVAADTSVLPFGSLVSVPGYDNGNVVPVLDRGGAIKGNRLDVLYATHERALRWGVQHLEVTIWEYADGQPNGFRQNHRRR